VRGANGNQQTSTKGGPNKWLRGLPLNLPDFAAVHESGYGRFCCKSLFALAIKNSFGRRRYFRVKMWGTSSPENKLTGDLGNVIECARQSWCDPAGASPAQVRSSVRLVASVAGPLATVVAKRTQRLHGVWD